MVLRFLFAFSFAAVVVGSDNMTPYFQRKISFTHAERVMRVHVVDCRAFKVDIDKVLKASEILKNTSSETLPLYSLEAQRVNNFVNEQILQKKCSEKIVSYAQDQVLRTHVQNIQNNQFGSLLYKQGLQYIVDQYADPLLTTVVAAVARQEAEKKFQQNEKNRKASNNSEKEFKRGFLYPEKP